MTTARAYHTATLLPTGRVLIARGSAASGPLATAELFDPASESGLVLIAGGVTDNDATTFAAELFDPATATFAATGSM